MANRFEWHGALAKDAVRRGARAGIAETAQEILRASLRVVPRETDALASAAGTDIDPVQPEGTVYYDDARDVKTIKQHEDLSYHHPPGETAKFLERPARAARGAFAASVARGIAKELR